VFAAGIVGSFALVLHNPVPHTLFAIPWIVWLALRPGRFRNLTLLAIGYLPGTLLLGAGWLWLQARLGNAPGQSQGIRELAAQLLRLAFSAPAPSLVSARLINLEELVLWAVPLVPFLACIAAFRRRRETSVRLLTASAAATLVGYLFVPYDQGHGWGYRYFHSAWFVLPLFAASVLDSANDEDGLLRRLTFAAALGSLLLCNGLRFAQVRTFIDDHLAQIPAPPRPARLEIVFVHIDRGYYSIDLVENDPFLRTGRWILISRGDAEDARFMHAAFKGARLSAQNEVAAVWEVD